MDRLMLLTCGKGGMAEARWTDVVRLSRVRPHRKVGSEARRAERCGRRA